MFRNEHAEVFSAAQGKCGTERFLIVNSPEFFELTANRLRLPVHRRSFPKPFEHLLISGVIFSLFYSPDIWIYCSRMILSWSCHRGARYCEFYSPIHVSCAGFTAWQSVEWGISKPMQLRIGILWTALVVNKVRCEVNLFEQAHLDGSIQRSIMPSCNLSYYLIISLRRQGCCQQHTSQLEAHSNRLQGDFRNIGVIWMYYTAKSPQHPKDPVILFEFVWNFTWRNRTNEGRLLLPFRWVVNRLPVTNVVGAWKPSTSIPRPRKTALNVLSVHAERVLAGSTTWTSGAVAGGKRATAQPANTGSTFDRCLLGNQWRFCLGVHLQTNHIFDLSMAFLIRASSSIFTLVSAIIQQLFPEPPAPTEQLNIMHS